MNCVKISPKVETKYILTLTQSELNVLHHVGNWNCRVAENIFKVDSSIAELEILNVLFDLYDATSADHNYKLR